MADGEECDGQGHQRSDGGGAPAVGSSVACGIEERHAGDPVRSPLEHPVDARPDRNAECQRRQGHKAQHHRNLRPPEPQRLTRPLCKRTRSHNPALSAGEPVADEDDDAQDDEDDRQRRCRRHVVRVELGEDLSRECPVPDDLEGTVFGEDDEGGEEASAEDGPACLAERHPEERLDATDPEAAGHFFLRRVGRPKAGCHWQVDEWVDGERHHDHGSTKPLDPRGQ